MGHNQAGLDVLHVAEHPTGLTLTLTEGAPGQPLLLSTASRTA
jgi:hypothetical protein